MAAALGVVLVGTGIAVATGAVQTPLSDSTTTPEAATLAPGLDMGMPSANANGYALATVPASMLPHPTRGDQVREGQAHDAPHRERDAKDTRARPSRARPRATC